MLATAALQLALPVLQQRGAKAGGGLCTPQAARQGAKGGAPAGAGDVLLGEPTAAALGDSPHRPA